MEANYSSIPKVRRPIRTIALITLGAIAIGIILWKYETNSNKENEESRII